VERGKGPITVAAIAGFGAKSPSEAQSKLLGSHPAQPFGVVVAKGQLGVNRVS